MKVALYIGLPIMLVALGAAFVFLFVGTVFEIPALIAVAIALYFSYPKLTEVTFEKLFKDTYANESWKYFHTIRSMKEKALNDETPDWVTYMDTFLTKDYYVLATDQVAPNGARLLQYALLEAVGDALPDLVGFTERETAAEQPREDHLDVVRIDGFVVVDLASTQEFNFQVIGPQKDQYITFSQAALKTMHTIILSRSASA